MNITLRQLAAFREVMRSGSISQAARAVGRTQPAVSTMIANLESELGFALFVREHGRLTATPEAHYFSEESDAILDRLDRTERTLHRIRQMEDGVLRIACHPAAAHVFLPNLLTDFLANKPKLQVALTMRSSDVVEDLVASQQYDIGFADTPAPRSSVTQLDYDLECLCLIPVDDPLASIGTVTPKDLDGKPIAALFESHTTAIQTKAAFEQEGYVFNKRLELRTFLPGLQFVAAGSCYMICDTITAYSDYIKNRDRQQFVMRRFRPRISNSVSILTPRYAPQSLTSKAFESLLVDAIRAMKQKIDAVLEEKK